MMLSFLDSAARVAAQLNRVRVAAVMVPVLMTLLATSPVQATAEPAGATLTQGLHDALADGRPFPAPVTDRTIAVPASIDASGSEDVSAALNSFIRSVPNGSSIAFPPRAVYRIDSAIRVGARSNLIFDGNGATLRMGSANWNYPGILFDLWDSRDIAVRSFKLIGSSPTPGVLRDMNEWASGVNISAGSRTELENLTIDRVYGDGLALDDWTDGVWFHHSHVVTAGRGGVSILAARNVIVENSTFDKVGLHPFNIEPWRASGGAINVRFAGNVVGDYGSPAPSAGQWAYFFCAEGAEGSTVENVTVTWNTVIERSIQSDVTRLTRRKDITVTNNRSLVAAGPAYGAPGVLWFAHVDGLTVYGNVQPLSWGKLISVTDSTDVRLSVP